MEVLHAWGMTEMSPLGTLCTLKNKHLAMSKDEQMKILQKQGRAIYGVDMKIVGGDGNELPWDGKTYGDLLVKGPWIVGSYFKGEGGDPLVRDAQGRGWFPTGDVATIDADGFVQITSLLRSVICMKPSASMVATSPVGNQPRPCASRTSGSPPSPLK